MITIFRRYSLTATLLGLLLGVWYPALGANQSASSADARALQMLSAKGTQWVGTDGRSVQLRGVNLGNWLMFEFWMMGQRTKAIDDQCSLQDVFDRRFGYEVREELLDTFRANWISKRDWDLMPQFGLNLVRIPFIWSLIEDEKNPRHLRANAWQYLDYAIREAETRGMYVVLDLHGAVGAQGWEHHSGCAGKNLFWKNNEYIERTEWLWQQIAHRYKDRPSVAGYSLLNEPWGVDETEMADVVIRLYNAVREIDRNHVVILPGHHSGIDAYGKPIDRGLDNVAFEMHFYPGHFGWAMPGLDVHRNWLQCLPDGGGTCHWNKRMNDLNAPLFVGEFQPWADLDDELGGMITRASYDKYSSYGWAAAAWSFKVLSNTGGQLKSNWGLVANDDGVSIPEVDFATASLQEITAVFRRFGTVPYRPRAEVIKWMKNGTAPDLSAMTKR